MRGAAPSLPGLRLTPALQPPLHSRFLRNECRTHKWKFDDPLPVFRMVSAVADKMQKTTVEFTRRPFGVGLLIAGYDVSVVACAFSTFPFPSFLRVFPFAGARPTHLLGRPVSQLLRLQG